MRDTRQAGRVTESEKGMLGTTAVVVAVVKAFEEGENAQTHAMILPPVNRDWRVRDRHDGAASILVVRVKGLRSEARAAQREASARTRGNPRLHWEWENPPTGGIAIAAFRERRTFAHPQIAVKPPDHRENQQPQSAQHLAGKNNWVVSYAPSHKIELED